MRSFGDIGHVRSLALPKVPVEVFWRSDFFKRATHFIFSEDDFHRLQSSQATGPDKFDCLSKATVTALPGADLHNLFGCHRDISNSFAFIDRE